MVLVIVWKKFRMANKNKILHYFTNKNILSYVMLLFGLAIISTGCTITANTDITFDSKDNMKVETTVLFPEELMGYSQNDASKQDLTKDIKTKIDGINIITEIQDLDSEDGSGNRKIEICKNISKAKKIDSIGLIIA